MLAINVSAGFEIHSSHITGSYEACFNLINPNDNPDILWTIIIVPACIISSNDATGSSLIRQLHDVRTDFILRIIILLLCAQSKVALLCLFGCILRMLVLISALYISLMKKWPGKHRTRNLARERGVCVQVELAKALHPKIPSQTPLLL